MEVNFYRMSDDERKIKKTLPQPMTLNCNVRRDVDIYNPHFLVKPFTGTVMTLFNYVGWNGAYYFIRDISYIARGLYRVETHIDVLMTYREKILASDCYISQSGIIDSYFDGGDYNHLETVEREVIMGDTTLPQAYSTIMISIGNKGNKG